MAIYNYSTDSHHTGGAKGIRVVVSVGPEIHQHYFSKNEVAEAKKCEADLLKQRDAYHRKINRTRKQNTEMGYDYTRTEVKGLRINIKMCKSRDNTPYYRCVIAMSIASTLTGNRANKAYIVTRDNLQAKWYEACTELAKHKGRVTAPKSWLDECPSLNDFRKAINGYMSSYPMADIGFKTLPKSKYPVTRSKASRSKIIKGY